MIRSIRHGTISHLLCSDDRVCFAHRTGWSWARARCSRTAAPFACRLGSSAGRAPSSQCRPEAQQLHPACVHGSGTHVVALQCFPIKFFSAPLALRTACTIHCDVSKYRSNPIGLAPRAWGEPVVFYIGKRVMWKMHDYHCENFWSLWAHMKGT